MVESLRAETSLLRGALESKLGEYEHLEVTNAVLRNEIDHHERMADTYGRELEALRRTCPVPRCMFCGFSVFVV